MNSYSIAAVPGDGIGKEVIAAGVEAEVLSDHRLSFTVAADEDYDRVRDAAAELAVGIFRMAPISHTLEDEFLVIARKHES